MKYYFTKGYSKILEDKPTATQLKFLKSDLVRAGYLVKSFGAQKGWMVRCYLAPAKKVSYEKRKEMQFDVDSGGDYKIKDCITLPR